MAQNLGKQRYSGGFYGYGANQSTPGNLYGQLTSYFGTGSSNGDGPAEGAGSTGGSGGGQTPYLSLYSNVHIGGVPKVGLSRYDRLALSAWEGALARARGQTDMLGSLSAEILGRLRGAADMPDVDASKISQKYLADALSNIGTKSFGSGLAGSTASEQAKARAGITASAEGQKFAEAANQFRHQLRGQLASKMGAAGLLPLQGLTMVNRLLRPDIFGIPRELAMFNAKNRAAAAASAAARGAANQRFQFQQQQARFGNMLSLLSLAAKFQGAGAGNNAYGSY